MNILPVVTALATCLLSVSSTGHDLPADAPPDDPAGLYIEALETYRIAQIGYISDALAEHRKGLRRVRSTNTRTDKFAREYEEYFRKRESIYMDQFKKIRKGDISELHIALDLTKAKVYDIGKLQPPWNHFMAIHRYMITEVINDTECIVEFHERRCHEMTFSYDENESLRQTFRLVGYPTQHMFLNAPYIFNEVFQIIGVENNEMYILHPVIFEDGTAFYPPKE